MLLLIHCFLSSVSPMTTWVENGVRPVYNQYHQQNPFSSHPLASQTETGLKTGTHGETEITTRSDKGKSSIIDYQSNPQWFTQGSYEQNSPHNKRLRSQLGITRMQRVYGPGGGKSTSSLFTGSSQRGGRGFQKQQTRFKHYPSYTLVSKNQNSKSDGRVKIHNGGLFGGLYTAPPSGPRSFHNVAQTGSRLTPYPPIIRKLSQTEAVTPLHQSSGPLQDSNPFDAWKSSDQGSVTGSDYWRGPESRTDHQSEYNTVRQTSNLFPFSSQSGRYQSSSLPRSRNHYGGYEEGNEFAPPRTLSTSSGIKSSKSPVFTSQTAPIAPSVRNSFDSSVIKNRPEKPKSSITDFSRGSVSNGERPRWREIQSYLFKDSQTSFVEPVTVTSGGQKSLSGLDSFSAIQHELKPSDPKALSTFSTLHHLQQAMGKDSDSEVQHLSDAMPPYYSADEFLYGGQTYSNKKTESFDDQPISTIYSPAPSQLPLHPTSKKGNAMESLVPTPLADYRGSHTVGSGKSAESSLAKTADVGGSMHGYKPGRSTKSIYGFRGFTVPQWFAVKESGEPLTVSNRRTDSQRYSFDQSKIGNVRLPLPSKYSFGQSRAYTTITQPLLAITERTPTDDSGFDVPITAPITSNPLLSPDASDPFQTTSVATPRPFTSGFQDIWPEDGNNLEFRNHKRLYAFKGFDTPSFSSATSEQAEGAKALVSEPHNVDAVQQGVQRFKLSSSQIWQPKSSRIQRWYKEMPQAEREPSATDVTSTQSANDVSSKDLEQVLTTAESIKSVKFPSSTPDEDEKNHTIYGLLGFQSTRYRNAQNKTQWDHSKESPATAAPEHRDVSASYGSSGDLKVGDRPAGSGQTSESETPTRTTPVEMKANLQSGHSSTSTMVRGSRVKGTHSGGKNWTESANGSSLAYKMKNSPIVRPKRPFTVELFRYADILGGASFSGVRAAIQTRNKPADDQIAPNATVTTQQKDVESVGGKALLLVNSEDDEHETEKERIGPEARAEGDEEDFISVQGSEFQDKEGSGSGDFDLSKTPQSREDLLELDYLLTSTRNVSFTSAKLSH